MASPPPSKPLELLEITVVSAKHLKNVNWLHGDLKPYAVAYLHPDRRAATRPDDSGSTKPVWNERLLLPLPHHISSSSYLLFLTIDVFHSKPSASDAPLVVGTARCPLNDLLKAQDPVRTLDLRRPSGRPQGKIRISLALRERPVLALDPKYPIAPSSPSPSASAYYYSPAPSTAAPREYRSHHSPPPPAPYNPPPPAQYPPPPPYEGYSDPYYGHYSASGYYSAPPAPAPAPPPAWLYYDRPPGYAGPSAPVDYSSGGSSPYYEHKPKGGRSGLGTGLAVGAVAGALGGLALEQGLKHEEDKITEKVESDLAPRDDYSDFRDDY